jgi:hypothetical protein
LQEERLVELEEELEGIKWDVIGISEVRRRGEQMVELKSGHHFYHIGMSDKSEAGVGFLVHKSLAGNISEIKGINERLAQLTLKINKRYKVKIIQVYAPTSTHDDAKVDKLYEEITELLHNSKTQFTIIMGDFNAKVGKGEEGEEDTIDQFGSGQRNDRDDRLIEFAICNKLKIMNTLFKKSASRRWTWRSPDGKTKNEIDFILTDKPTIFQDVKVVNKVNVGSDHRMLLGKIKINTRLERQKLLRSKPSNINLEKLSVKKEVFKLELHNRFKLLHDEHSDEDRTLETWNEQIVDAIQESAMKVAGKNTKSRHNKISDSTRKLMDKRRLMKMDSTGIEGVEYTETCKTIRKKLREDIRNHNSKMIEATIEGNKSLKKTQKKLAHGKQKITSLLDKNGQEITEQDQILKRIEEFYEQLYASDKETEEPGNSFEPIPDVTDWEVKHAINHMSRGKAAGPDAVLIDTIKDGEEVVTKELAKLFTECLHQGKVPQQWKEANMILIYKKGNKKDLKNYRPISLLSNIYKLFTRILTNRLEGILDSNQPREQAGFRRTFSTIDHIHTINQLKEKCQEYNIPICLAFVDYEKAFDSVETCSVLEALQEQGINNKYIKLMRDIYSDSSTTVRLHKESNKIKINKGVRQGDTISPKLFTACLEKIFRSIDWTEKGINVNGERFNHLRFADDIIIITDNLNNIESMLKDLDIASRNCGLKMNMGKTKIMAGPTATSKPVKLNGTLLEQVDEYIYLGQRFSLIDKNQDNEIRRRIKAGWQAFGRHNQIMKGTLPICLKRKVFNQCILPAMTYGAETWTLSSKMESKLAAAQHNMERSILNITYKDRKTNKWVRDQTKVQDIMEIIKNRKWTWAGHVSRRTDNRWSTALTVWTPIYGKRNRGRQRKRWRDELQQYWGSVNWYHKARNRDLWRQHAKAFVLQWTDHS